MGMNVSYEEYRLTSPRNAYLMEFQNDCSYRSYFTGRGHKCSHRISRAESRPMLDLQVRHWQRYWLHCNSSVLEEGQSILSRLKRCVSCTR